MKWYISRPQLILLFTGEPLKAGENLALDSVDAIQLHLKDTNDKQGKKAPIKFSLGLRRAITLYASKNGNPETARFFSEKIGQPMSTSRVRGICKRYRERCNKARALNSEVRNNIFTRYLRY